MSVGGNIAVSCRRPRPAPRLHTDRRELGWGGGELAGRYRAVAPDLAATAPRRGRPIATPRDARRRRRRRVHARRLLAGRAARADLALAAPGAGPAPRADLRERGPRRRRRARRAAGRRRGARRRGSRRSGRGSPASGRPSRCSRAAAGGRRAAHEDRMRTTPRTTPTSARARHRQMPPLWDRWPSWRCRPRWSSASGTQVPRDRGADGPPGRRSCRAPGTPCTSRPRPPSRRTCGFPETLAAARGRGYPRRPMLRTTRTARRGRAAITWLAEWGCRRLSGMRLVPSAHAAHAGPRARQRRAHAVGPRRGAGGRAAPRRRLPAHVGSLAFAGCPGSSATTSSPTPSAWCRC